MDDFVFEQDTCALPTSAARPRRKREFNCRGFFHVAAL
jgi:hypothetical protein